VPVVTANATRTERLAIAYAGGVAEISVTLRPGGDDLLLCLHGLGCAKESFEAAFHDPELAGLTVCAFDFPGHGTSGRLADAAEYSIQTYADLTVGLVRELSPRRIFLLCHSMGCAVGLVATQELARRPDVFISVEGNLVSQDCGLVSRRVAGQRRDEFLAGHQRFRSELTTSSRTDLRAWGDWYAQADPAALHRAAASLVEWSDSGKLLGMFLSQPRPAYIFGSDSDLDYLLPLLSDVPVREIPGSGHFPMIDNPDPFWRAVADLVATG
jgi:pimeloyl-ACP methyl ester carboxylesterase